MTENRRPAHPPAYLRLAPLAVVVVAAILNLTGLHAAALACFVLGVVGLLVVWRTSAGRRRGPAIDLDAAQAARIREERERDGEIAAVRLLRAQQPDLSLADAALLVRRL